jgi:hypothetical protein
MSNTTASPSPGTLLRGVLRELPLLGEDVYLTMQATNLGMVDDFLMGLEASVLSEYGELDRTPLESAAFLSAVSQLWIFGVYELLRTWRQRVRDALQLDSELRALAPGERQEPTPSAPAQIAGASPGFDRRQAMSEKTIQRVASDPTYIESIRAASDKTESLFRRIEALRVHLAKHEVPKVRGSVAFAPGYGRIDMETGSIYYQFEVRPPQVDVLSRRAIADACRGFAEDRRRAMLPEAVRASMRRIAEIGYGAKQVIVTLRDGTEFENVYVLWDREVAAVGTEAEQPFDARDIVAIRAVPQ